jgi:deoxyribose-phosphate aldolase
VKERVAALSTRSIKKDSKAHALRLAVRMMDLTTLEGMDTPGKVAQMSAKAVHPDPTDPSIPSVAAVCVYPAMVPYARQAVEGSGVKVAAVSTYFPSGQADLGLRWPRLRRWWRRGPTRSTW